MAASITVHLQIFKHLQLLSFSTDLDETGIKIHGLLRSFIYNVVIVRVAVPFKKYKKQNFATGDWSTDCKKAFQTLKTALSSPPILGYPDMNKSFI